MTDEMIVRLIRNKDPAGLEGLMDRYIPYVSTVVWNILRYSMQPEDAEEVVSDVFLAAWEQARDLRPGQLKSWLGSVARHKAINKLRELGHDLPLEEDVLELPGDQGPEPAAARAEERILVNRALEQMGPEDREIFLRHYYHAQTLREIADEMAINESTVKTRLRRGRMKLRDILTKWGAV